MSIHREGHRSHVGGWLRAAVLGANDGIVSIAALVLGVAAADASVGAVATAGLAGLVGGALSMAAGEFVSVGSQRDLEQADLAKERAELDATPERELAELAAFYRKRGLDEGTAHAVAEQLTAVDALRAHAREELNLDLDDLANPGQAALVSAVSFALGAALPLVAIVASPRPWRLVITLAAATVALAVLGGLSARLGGAPVGRAVARVVVGGVLAMGITMAIGSLFGVTG